MINISNKQFLKRIIDNANENAIPVFGAFELTPYCNLDCKMCYVHLYDPQYSERMLDGNQWIELMDAAIEKGMISALLTGGEAMTHPDFWDIYMHLIEKGIQVRVKTNGLLLTKNVIEKLNQYQPFMIDVSLYGCNDDSYEAVTGKRAFQKVKSNIENLIANQLPLTLEIVPSKYMMPYIKDIMSLAKSFDVRTNVNKMLIEPNDNTDRTKEEFDLTRENHREIIKLTKEFFEQKQAENEDEFVYETGFTKELKCNAGTCTFAVSWEGIMKPCLNFPEDLISVKLEDMGFERAWKHINDKMAHYSIPEKCHTCEYHDECRYCPREHGQYAKRNQCDASVCEAWKYYFDIEREFGQV
ncbi:MAG: radical SAM protein [Lachnospiraceae bacterium]|nr:radical SAM protein [Lachnospiraceae bacterium]